MTAVVLRGDARSLPLPDGCVDLVVTSPPYFGLRSYTDGGVHYAGQVGSEGTPAEWLEVLWACTAEMVRVLKPSGSIFVNLGDKYSNGGRTCFDADKKYAQAEVKTLVRRTDDGFAPKSLLGLPWRFAIGCTDRLGLILRAEIIWSKPNGLPESVTDRVRRAHEQVFHLVKQPRYYSAVDEIREATEDIGRKGKAMKAGPLIGNHGSSGHDGNGMRMAEVYNNPLGKLPGSVWTIPAQPLTVPPSLGVDHFAAFPMGLVRPVILGWSPPGICTACGEGRRPIADKRLIPIHEQANNRKRMDGLEPFGNSRGINADHRVVGATAVTITGYACACPQPDAPTQPAVVLDPFGGTGTTALVAHALGRHAITIDMSADYCRLAAWRTSDPGQRAQAAQVPKPPPVADGQGSLFDDLELT